MKSLTLRVKKTLLKTKGETLVEAIVSILILTIMLTTIAAMISVSIRMTANSMVEARAVQQGMLNPAFLGDLPAGADITSVTISSFSAGITAEHDALVFDNDAFETTQNIVAFYPDPSQDVSIGEP